MNKTLPLSLAAVLALSACVSTAPKVGDPDAKTVATGAAGGANASNANPELEKCASPMGTLAVVEDTSANWYQVLTGQYKLPSTAALLRLLVQQSNCFVVVERGRAMNNMQQERALQQAGELRSQSNFGKGQMVSADYSLNPEVLFSERGTGGLGGAIGGFGGGAALVGAVVGSMKTNEAATILTLVDNRSGVQVAVAEGSSKNTDFALGGVLGGIGGAAGLGGYTNTPQGKVIAAAFMNAYNQLVVATRNYRAQTIPGQGLGTGGKLNVDGAAPAPAPAARPAARPAPAPAAGTPAVTNLKQAQERLGQLGYDAGVADGKIGAKTTAALRLFQKDHNLPETGRLDQATMKALSQ